MAEERYKLIKETILTDIANAIREKVETEETFYPHDMGDAIREIETGEIVHHTEVTVTSSEQSQVVNPMAPYNGFSKVTVNPIPSQYKKLDRNTTVTENDLLLNKTAYNKNGEFITGTIPVNGQVGGNISSKNDIISIPSGYTSGGSVSIGATEKAKLIPENIKQGVTILGVQGSAQGEVTLEDVTVKSSGTTQTVTAGQGYDGIGTVTVNPIALQDKTVTPSANYQVVTPDEGKDGLSSVTVNNILLQSKSATPSRSIQVVRPDNNYQGLSYVSVQAAPLDYSVNVSAQNANSTIYPTSGNVGIEEINVKPLQNKTVKSTGTQQTVTVDSTVDYLGLGTITVSPLVLQDKTVTPSSSQQTITADSGYDGLGTVTVGAGGGGTDTLAQAFTFEGIAEYTITDVYQVYPKIKKGNFPNITEVSSYKFGQACTYEEINLPNATTIGTYGFQTVSQLKRLNAPLLEIPTTLTGNCLSTLSALEELNIKYPITMLPNTTIFQGIGINQASNNRIDISFTGDSTMSLYRYVMQNCRVRNLTISDVEHITTQSSPIFSSLTVFGDLSCPDLIDASVQNGSNGPFSSYSLYGALNLPKLKTAGNNCFSNLNLYSTDTTLTFPSLESIGTNGFYSVRNMTAIYLPKLTTMGDTVFRNCTNLVNLYLGGDTLVPLDSTSVFTASGIQNNASARIHVRPELEAEYKAATNWSSFQSKIVGDYTPT